MGTELARQPDRASASYSYDSASSAAQPTVGKSTGVPQQYDAHDEMVQLIELVQQLAGQTVTDHGGYWYQVLPQGTFQIIVAPDGHDHALGCVIKFSDRAWKILAHIIIDTGQCTAPLDMSYGQPAPPPDQSLGQPAPSPQQPAPAPAPAPKKDDASRPVHAPKVATLPEGVKAEQAKNGDWQYMMADHAPVEVGDLARPTCVARRTRPEMYKENDAEQDHVEVTQWVRVLEVNDRGNARIEVLADQHAKTGTEWGWVRAKKLSPITRTARGSSASDQMSNLASAARSANGQAHGNCYRYVKNYITLAGGYGDIRDIYTDVRFTNLQDKALDFHEAVQRAGAGDLGLQLIPGHDVAAQQQGTIIVAKSNGKNGIDPVAGDISVVGPTSGGWVTCYNDGIIPFPVDLAQYESGQGYGDMIVAMYKPVDRK